MYYLINICLKSQRNFICNIFNKKNNNYNVSLREVHDALENSMLAY